MQIIKVIDIQAEAELTRQIKVCNACRYCEGFCPVFPALQSQQQWQSADLDYLANLCHNCGACYHSCQYAQPHQLNINIPQKLAQHRLRNYLQFATPQKINLLFQKHILAVVVALLISLGLVVFAVKFENPNFNWFYNSNFQGDFYRVISHKTMVLLAVASLLFSTISIIFSCFKYAKNIGLRFRNLSVSGVVKTVIAAASLKHLGGGQGQGCNSSSEVFSNVRRVMHHFTAYGFLLCFAATSVATIYHYVFGLLAPYAYLSVPVILGTVGGVAIVIGTIGQFSLKIKAHSATKDSNQSILDYLFIVLLFLVSITGLALLVWRGSNYMGMLLVVHLATVFCFFAIIPFSKFVHLTYRFIALLKYYSNTSSANA